MAFNSIKDILNKIRAHNPKLEKRLEEALAVDSWEKTVGTQIANHARVLKVEEGVLWVEVDHSVWRTELHHRKHQILEKLNAVVFPKESGKKVIKDLFLIEPKRTHFSAGADSGLKSLRNSKNLKKNKPD